MFKYLHRPFLILFIFMGIFSSSLAQTERNPLIEFCTGTWCQWCPCGDFTIEQLLIAHPNLIPLAYHGPAGQDPYSVFPGNEIINLIGFSGYPTAVVDRATGSPGDYTTWTSKVNSRLGVPATVTIDLQRTFDPSTGQLNATINMTPLQDLIGQYKYNIVLTEDSLIYTQVNNGVCVSGGANWIHYWVVRAMINGAAGENVNTSSPWTSGDMISKSISYSVPLTYNPDKCNLIVFVYKQNTPLYSAEVQQAMQYPLIAPDYVASASNISPDVIADNNTVAEFNMVIKNLGLLNDKYDIGVSSTCPPGWIIQFTTVNGTFDMGETDSVEVATDDSTIVTVTVNPNGIDGSAFTFMEYSSRNNPATHGTAMARNVTTTGVYGLVIDATNNKYVSYLDSSLQDVFGESYGIVSRNALAQGGVDLSNFHLITWSQGNSLPAFHPAEVDELQSYLTGGGNLFINGQNIGSDIFEPTGQSQFAQNFYHNYLHAGYVANSSSIFLIKGVVGDVIGDGMQFVPGFIYDKSLDKISRYDSFADSSFQYLNGPSVAGIRSDNNTSRVVYVAFGVEQIDNRAVRDTLIARSVNWLMENVVPVELTSFTASSVKSSVNLYWSTATETNNSGFEIQRTINGKFQPIGFIQGNGTTVKPHSYSFIDKELTSGTYSYRLKQIDFDGKINYSKIVEATIAPMAYSLAQNYPNPFNPITRINYSIAEKGTTRLIIYDMLGREIVTLVNQVQEPGLYNISFDASKLPSGIYAYKLQSGNFVQAKKMMLIK